MNVTYALVQRRDAALEQLECSRCGPLVPLAAVEGIEGLILTAHVHHALEHPAHRGWVLIQPAAHEVEEGEVLRAVPRVIDAP